jgi:hypothetical protein
MEITRPKLSISLSILGLPPATFFAEGWVDDIMKLWLGSGCLLQVLALLRAFHFHPSGERKGAENLSGDNPHDKLKNGAIISNYLSRTFVYNFRNCRP